MVQQKKGLGKGLGALLNNIEEKSEKDEKKEKNEKKSGIINIDINKIEPNAGQPRKYFDDESLEGLAESIKSFGIIQPLIVKDEGEYYSIIAGERRWRAARLAKLKEIPVIIKEYNEVETLQIALIENIQRQDLNPIEEAYCYKKLSDEYFFSQEDIANKVGKSRSVISNALVLLNLDSKVQNFIVECKISASHGRALLSIKNPEKQFQLAEQIIEDQMSLRELENEINFFNEYLEKIKLKEYEKEKIDIKKENIEKISYKKIESDLQTIFGTKVAIKPGKKKSKIEIEYFSPDELDRLLGIIKGL